MEDLAKAYRTFIGQFKSALLSTADASGVPNISYAPIVFRDGIFYVYLSDLARHTQNLRVNPRVALMFIQDERDAEQIFARTRVTLDCQAKTLARDSDTWLLIMNEFSSRFGDVMDTLSKLTDFQLLALKPVGGQFVKDFAKAFRITGADLDKLVHIRRDD